LTVSSRGVGARDENKEKECGGLEESLLSFSLSLSLSPSLSLSKSECYPNSVFEKWSFGAFCGIFLPYSERVPSGYGSETLWRTSLQPLPDYYRETR
jgi:hypothetical protein